MSTATMRNLAVRGEGLVVRAALRVADRVAGPWARRRRLSPYVLLVVESTEGGADYATATAVARRLLRQHGTAGGPSLRRLQRAARTHSAASQRDASQRDATHHDATHHDASQRDATHHDATRTDDNIRRDANRGDDG